ncbi:type I-E CRISPR-associated protein Cas7/Cse4/CasC (plasmid) [Deinococcus sp. KNUC1210]|uniref:type I-E CRISPR-associated protein Cas7/Cse4/CasC n=1 Tax=Deinococcus sp. KNUC1210 TaxID=2917691 RepID=UPI001EF14007|nr:type I-E CRISPR-associated protein Cas7/Cse4/CasC [Deinococcus sp. KNUC1210]ULH13947.1 type I-E CRISPR-associated protein Cas7/Cse4/CasC [Deinococcus sp. KNUC1210]
MKALLELHLLQNYAPSSLNRDDTGSPKDAYFGGVRRGRISSQSLKRAMRMDFKQRALLSADELGERTRRAHEAIRDLLKQAGHGHEESERAAARALAGLGLLVHDGRTQYLLFLGKDELRRVADLVLAHWSVFTGVDLAAPDNGRNKAKASKKAVLPGDLGRALLEALDGSKAVDVALFGRMLADLPQKNVDAAAQVAHALGTHAMSRREFDFFSAVDDLRPHDSAAADMLGTTEFGSATFYRYICLDLKKLRGNLSGDDDLLLRGLNALLYATVFAVPSGKQNTFAAYNLPSLISSVVREDASPRNLANAFEVPVGVRDGGYISGSIHRLTQEWARQERIFGQGGRGRYVNAHDERDLEVLGENAGTVERLITQVLADAADVLGRLES